MKNLILNRRFFVLTAILSLMTSVFSANADCSIGKKRSEKAYRYEVTLPVMQQIIEGKIKNVTDVLPPMPIAECDIEELDTINSGIGRWVWSWIDGAELRFKVENNVSFKTCIFGEEDGIIAIQVKSSDGKIIDNAELTLEGKNLKFNPSTMCYETKTPRSDKTRKLIVKYGDEIQSYEIHKNGYKNRKARRFYPQYKEKNPYFLSYLTLDKPEYRPNDSIRWKAVIMNLSGKYEKQSFELWIEPYYSSNGKKIGTIDCERAGVYIGAFQLSDSMNLQLNSPYRLVLKNKQGSIISSFQYKDYELKSLTAEVDVKDMYLFGDTCIMTINATDEKGDKITSGTAKIRLETSNANYIYDNTLFVPELLCDTTIDLSSTGATLLEISTAAWPKADMRITWQATITDNTYEKAVRYGSFSYQKENIRVYNATNLSIQTMEQADTIGFKILNPDSVMFRYAIYCNKKLMTTASAKVLDWKLPTPKEAIYTIIVNAGNDRQYQAINYDKNGLRVEVEQPENITPGGNVDITVKVYDSKGRPVEGAEVTAVSRTAKFSSHIQSLPSTKKDINLYIRQVYGNPTPLSLNGTYTYSNEISRLMGVDTLDHYRMLTHTGTAPFILSKPAENTTVAPYIVKDGRLQPVEIVYIDSKPVYIAMATNTSPYVFETTPGLHNISVRTADAIYHINDIELKKSTKTWIALKARKPKEKGVITENNVSSMPMPAYLTDDEQQYFSKYGLMRYTVSPQCGLPYIKFKNGNIVALNSNNYSHFYTGTALMPEISGQYMETDSLGQNISMRWLFVPNTTTNIYPIDNLILARTHPSAQKQPLNTDKIPHTDDVILTEELLTTQWNNYINARRRYMNIDVSSYNGNGNCRLDFIYENTFDNNNAPLNTILISGSDTVIYEGNRRNFYRLKAQKYKIVMLFDSAKAYTFDATVKPSGSNCIMITNGMTAKAEANKESIKIDREIRLKVEKILRNTTSRYIDFSTTDNTYSTTQRKFKPLHLMSATGGLDVMYDSNDIAYDMVAAPIPSLSPEFAEEESVIVDNLLMLTEDEIRSNFNDVAYWQPDLVTDKGGKVTFTVTYPEDLTRWNEFFIAIKGKQRGLRHTSVITRKDIVATLTTPRFVIEGDSINVIGRAINYSDEAISVSRGFNVTDLPAITLPVIELKPSITDLLPIKTPLGDSISVVYSINNRNTSDGERRTIPVYRKGAEEIFSMFDILSGERTVTIDPIKEKGDVEIYIMSDMLAVLMEEITKRDNQDYNTNDMIASELLSLLAEKQIREYRGEKFKSDFEVRQLIRKLENNQLSSGLWSWQGNKGNKSLWVSAHICSALNRARSLGYDSDIIDNKQMLIQYLVQYANTAHEKENISDQLTITDIMLNIGYRNEARNALSAIDKSALYNNELLRYTLLDSKINGTYDLSAIDSLLKKDMLGGEYYAFKHKVMPLAKIYEPVEYADLQTTLIAYELWMNSPDSQKRDNKLKSMEQWILRQRRGGYWVNEYLSSRIIDLLLPRFIATKGNYVKSTVTIEQGKDVMILNSYPQAIKLTPENGVITVTKKGSEDIYISSTQTSWNNNPQSKSGDFRIDTRWQNPTLVRGENARLIVTVTAEKEAEYVVISVPVPGGCSYNDHQPRSMTETHREEYRNKVNIYCERMSAGTHTFEIDLTPRFNGRYTINPATVKMIYFPAFNANNMIKSVDIK